MIKTFLWNNCNNINLLSIKCDVELLKGFEIEQKSKKIIINSMNWVVSIFLNFGLDFEISDNKFQCSDAICHSLCPGREVLGVYESRNTYKNESIVISVGRNVRNDNVFSIVIFTAPPQ